MIISDSHKFIFIHIPKCGGTSIRNVLRNFDTRNNYFWMHEYLPGATNQDFKQPIDKAHMTIPIFKRLYPKDFDLLKEYTVFTFVRNPVKRIVSSFWETRKNLFEVFDKNQSDINERIKLQKIFNSYLSNIVHGISFLNPSFLHATPQHMFIVDEKKTYTDVIIKLEEPNEGIKSLGVLLPEVANKISSQITNTKFNVSSTSKKDFLWDDVPTDLKRAFLKFYTNDFDLLNYKKPI